MKKRGKNLKFKKVKLRNIIFLFLRYLILLALMFSLPIIYKILTPLTIYPTIFLLKFFFNNIILLDTFIIINEKMIQIIPACIAGSAYLLLLILNLSLPLNLKKRIYSIIFSLSVLLVLNILRITFLSILYYHNFVFFDFTHKFFWFFLSTLFVVFIWFLTAKIFNIKEIPIYSDLKYLIKLRKKN